MDQDEYMREHGSAVARDALEWSSLLDDVLPRNDIRHQTRRVRLSLFSQRRILSRRESDSLLHAVNEICKAKCSLDQSNPGDAALSKYAKCLEVCRQKNFFDCPELDESNRLFYRWIAARSNLSPDDRAALREEAQRLYDKHFGNMEAVVPWDTRTILLAEFADILGSSYADVDTSEPSYGIVREDGNIPLGYSLGRFFPNLERIATMLSEMFGADRKYSTAFDELCSKVLSRECIGLANTTRYPFVDMLHLLIRALDDFAETVIFEGVRRVPTVDVDTVEAAKDGENEKHNAGDRPIIRIGSGNQCFTIAAQGGEPLALNGCPGVFAHFAAVVANNAPNEIVPWSDLNLAFGSHGEPNDKKASDKLRRLLCVLNRTLKKWLRAPPDGGRWIVGVRGRGAKLNESVQWTLEGELAKLLRSSAGVKGKKEYCTAPKVLERSTPTQGEKLPARSAKPTRNSMD